MNACHHVRLMHMSTSSRFPQVDTEKRRVGRDDDDEGKGSVGRHFRGIWDLFMLVPHIIVLICLNQSEPGGVGEYIFSVWIPP